MTIWKYPITPNENMFIDMPKGAQIIHINTQHGSPHLWAIVDPSEPKETRVFGVYGTGHTLPESPKSHVGSFLMYNDNLVFHVFEYQKAQEVKS